MAVNINTKELYAVLNNTPSSQNIMLVGKHGIGKSKIISDFFDKKKMKVVTLFLGQMSDPGDLIGLPHLDEKSGNTEFMPPYWFPVDNKPIVLFLDELNRARPEILQTVMDLTLNRTLAGKKLPENSYVVSAVNDGEEYQLTDLDPALISRFNIYNFHPSNSEWLLWATQSKMIDKRIISFIEENPSYLDDDRSNAENQGLDKTPDRRSWERVSELLPALELKTNCDKKLIAGVVGTRAAARFFESLSENRILSGALLLKNFKKHLSTLKTYGISEIAIVNENVYRMLETKEYKPSEKDNIVDNFERYTDWLLDQKSNEMMAHFVSFFENATYLQANLFMMTDTPKFYRKMTNFIKSL